MKKIALSLMALTLFIMSATAQKQCKVKKHHAHHHQKSMVMKQLNFSSAQQKQLKANNESFKKQMAELNKNENISLKEYRDKKEVLQRDKKATFQGLLTNEQKGKLDQIKKEKAANHEMKAAKKMDRMKSELGLSDEQATKIKTERAATHAQIKAIKENNKLSRTERKAQLMALKEANKESFRKNLTPEQLNKLENIKKKKMEKVSSI